MPELSLVRQELRSRLSRREVPAPVRLGFRLLEGGHGWLLPALTSPLAQDLLENGYDAVSLDRLCGGRSSLAGPVGMLADRMVLGLPEHVGLLERHQAAVGELVAAVVEAGRQHEGSIRVVVTAPGLGGTLMALWERLGERHAALRDRLEIHLVEADAEVLRAVQQRCATLGIPVLAHHGELHRSDFRNTILSEATPADVISLVGADLAPDDLTSLLGSLTPALRPGGIVITDRWEKSPRSRLVQVLGLRPPVTTEAEARAAYQSAGLDRVREHPTGEGGCVVTVARKPR